MTTLSACGVEHEPKIISALVEAMIRFRRRNSSPDVVHGSLRTATAACEDHPEVLPSEVTETSHDQRVSLGIAGDRPALVTNAPCCAGSASPHPNVRFKVCD